MSEYIRTNKFDTNECLNIFVKEKLIRTNVRIYIRDQYIRIFEYSNIFVTLCYICERLFSLHILINDKSTKLVESVQALVEDKVEYIFSKV